ncbi:MAG: hypothetical protein D6704_00780 [Nitrospirae bacterium]|nr:MAG: hypothetical protein D6704_00780 [Nitrospirota bacterium]
MGGNPFSRGTRGAELYERIVHALPRLALVHSPGQRQSSLINEIRTCPLQELLGSPIRHAPMGRAVQAGLFLRAEGWDEAHHTAQGLSTREGSYWHGIVHRREPDVSNAKYWFRHVGTHPVFDDLWRFVKSATNIHDSSTWRRLASSGAWDPFAFIDLCVECATGTNRIAEAELEALQDEEITLLLQYCLQQAVGGAFEL